MDFIKEKYEKLKLETKETQQINKKMDYILFIINDIKMNKKLPNDIGNRLEFLKSWLKKGLVQK